MDLRQLRQEILIEERDLYELIHLFEELVQYPTPAEEGLETNDDFNKCEICFEKEISNMLPCGV